MTGRPWLFGLVGLIFLAQLAVPASLVWRHERALHEGTRHLFKCVSRDPVDLFRGRYLNLNLDATASGASTTGLSHGRLYYGRLQQMEDGYTRIVELLETPPSGQYVTVRVNRWTSLELPFDRYYLNEHIAPQVDEVFRKDLRSGRIEATLAVRVFRGTATLEELLLNGMPVADYMRSQPTPPPGSDPSEQGD